MSNINLVEAGLKLASSVKANSNRGTIYMDRTIYHTIQITDSEGKGLFDSDGNPIVVNTAYVLAGSYLSPAVYEKALELEKKFKALNELFRKDMDDKKIQWKFRKTDQKALFIQGVT